MANKQREYDRGRSHGLQLAMRILKEAGDKQGYELIREEIRLRGKLNLNVNLSMKEIEEGLEPIKKCMYESFLCQALMTIHDEFGFGKTRCERFLKRWNLKTDCLGSGLVTWGDNVQCIKEELGIDVPSEAMKLEGLINEEESRDKGV